jgi:hypothetical protein
MSALRTELDSEREARRALEDQVGGLRKLVN